MHKKSIFDILYNKIVIKTSLVLFALLILSYLGYGEAYGYGSSTFFLSADVVNVPSVVSSSNYPLTVTSVQTGTLRRNFNNGSEVRIDVAQGTVLSKVEFDVTLGIINNAAVPKETDKVTLVDNYSYDIVATDLIGNKITSFEKEIKIVIAIPGFPSGATVEKIGLYYYEEASGDWIFVPETDFNLNSNLITFRTNHLTEFAVFVYKTEESQDRIETYNSGEVKGVIAVSGTLYGLDSELADSISLMEARMVNVHESLVDLNEQEKRVYDKVAYSFDLPTKTQYQTAYFIKHGTDTTKKLGAGERAGVINSYKEAFGDIPVNEQEWQDVVKIANGRWPSKRNEERETEVESRQFFKVYNRYPNMDNQNDNAAVTIMTYGLRPVARNLNSETFAIKTFKSIYNYNPVSGSDWDIVRAVAYSGAVR